MKYVFFAAGDADKRAQRTARVTCECPEAPASILTRAENDAVVPRNHRKMWGKCTKYVLQMY